LLLADLVCSRNTSEFCRVGSEEVLQSLRAVSGDGANCIGNGARLFIVRSFRRSKVFPETRQMIERVGIDVTSHCLGPLFIGDGNIPDRTVKRGAQCVDDLLARWVLQRSDRMHLRNGYLTPPVG
jgi:hypothetical protein